MKVWVTTHNVEYCLYPSWPSWVSKSWPRLGQALDFSCLNLRFVQSQVIRLGTEPGWRLNESCGMKFQNVWSGSVCPASEDVMWPFCLTSCKLMMLFLDQKIQNGRSQINKHTNMPSQWKHSFCHGQKASPVKWLSSLLEAYSCVWSSGDGKLQLNSPSLCTFFLIRVAVPEANQTECSTFLHSGRVVASRITLVIDVVKWLNSPPIHSRVRLAFQMEAEHSCNSRFKES